MKILVGYDGSEASEHAVEEARKRANALGGEVVIVTSMNQGPALRKEDIERAEGELEYVRTPFNVDDISCETIVSVNYLTNGEDLVRLSIDNHVDEIIIGIKKKSKVGKLLFGSTAQYVILHAPCPVVSVK